MSEYIERYWRDATPEDAIKEPPMLARFGNGIIYSTLPLPLAGTRFSIKATHRLWYTETGELWTHCQVYDAPEPGEGWRLIDVDKDKPQFSDEYYLHGSKTWTPREHVRAFSTEQFYRRRIEQPKPDPGEGWRLIDPEKDKPQEGDEYREKWDVAWKPRNELSTTLFAPETFYRRRIEQPKPEPRYEPFRWEDREQLRGRWIAYDDGNFEVYPTSFFLAESTFFVGTLDAQKLVDHWRFLDTGEPVGRKVE